MRNPLRRTPRADPPSVEERQHPRKHRSPHTDLPRVSTMRASTLLFCCVAACAALAVPTASAGGAGRRLLQTANPPQPSDACTDVPPDTQFTCQQQRDFGKCGEAFITDNNYCAATCGLAPCKTADGFVKNPMQPANACTDMPPDQRFSCEQQASFGACNASFMTEGRYCARTCGRCAESSPSPSPEASPSPSPSPSPAAEASPSPSPAAAAESSPSPSPAEESSPSPSPEAPSPSPEASPSPGTPESGAVDRLTTCTDDAPTSGLTCEQQFALGQCGAKYMTGGNFCARTCGRAPCPPLEAAIAGTPEAGPVEELPAVANTTEAAAVNATEPGLANATAIGNTTELNTTTTEPPAQVLPGAATNPSAAGPVINPAPVLPAAVVPAPPAQAVASAPVSPAPATVLTPEPIPAFPAENTTANGTVGSLPALADNATAPAESAVSNVTAPAESTVSNVTAPAESTVSNVTAPIESGVGNATTAAGNATAAAGNTAASTVNNATGAGAPPAV